jgi:hypothetical protein
MTRNIDGTFLELTKKGRVVQAEHGDLHTGLDPELVQKRPCRGEIASVRADLAQSD